MAIESLQALVTASENRDICDVIIESDCVDRGVTQAESLEKMRGLYAAIRRAQRGYDPKLRSASGMAGGDGAKFSAYRMRENRLLGDYLTEVMERALKMAESNACMKRIVAAPTAGAGGVLPAVLVPYFQKRCKDTDKILKAMYVAAGIGQIIATRSSISGAAGGCQAEIGTASAMAAGALAYLQGADNEQIMQAATFALKNMLGLACDPVGGLVEVPCVKRNVAGVVNAISSAQLALAGITSVITPDDTIDSMRRIGNDLPSWLKETSKGGLAVTESAKKIMERFKAPQI